jgi:hypothetical protein
MLFVGAGLALVWGAGARAGRAVQRGVASANQVAGMAGRVVGTTITITAGQWITLRLSGDPLVWALALGLPAVLAAVTLGRLFTVAPVVRASGRSTSGTLR